MGQALSRNRPDLAQCVEHVVPFFAFAPSIRKMIYTTNAVEALHRSLRKIIKTPASFPTRRGGAQTDVPRHQERRRSLAAAGRVDRRNGPVRHPLWRSVSRNRPLMSTIDITAPTMIAWSEPWPSSSCGAPLRGLTARSGQAELSAMRLMPIFNALNTNFNLHRNRLHRISDIPGGLAPATIEPTAGARLAGIASCANLALSIHILSVRGLTARIGGATPRYFLTRPTVSECCLRRHLSFARSLFVRLATPRLQNLGPPGAGILFAKGRVEYRARMRME